MRSVYILACLYLLPFAISAQQQLVSDHYPADIECGVIGVTGLAEVDYPEDNVFHIYMDRLPGNGETAVLVYDLKGVGYGSHTGKSVNAYPAHGGVLAAASGEWRHQRESIDQTHLKHGLNVIRFTKATDADYAYEVRNIAIQIIQRSQPGLLTLHEDSLAVFDGVAYISGFVDAGLHLPSLRIGGSLVPLIGGQFETIVEPGNEKTIRIELLGNNVLLEERLVSIHQHTDHLIYRGTISAQGGPKSAFVNAASGDEIHLERAAVSVPGGTLSEDTHISIGGLRGIDIPTLNPDMVNVTDARHAYRFLPDGIQFSGEARLKMGYNSDAIPDGYTDDDVHTFYFDDQQKKWVEVVRDSVDIEKALVYSRTTHFTDYINAVIKLPETPESNPSIANTIGELKYADPAAQITTIDPPGPNELGSVVTGFPLKLPPGRNGMQPLLSIDYNSEGSNGWLGLGWHLDHPAFTIDTRWGVPRFSADKESETYLFNGQQLYPVAHRAAWQDRTSEKQFYPRVEGEFQRIIRHGSGTKNYWWEVADKDGMRHYYGGKPGSGIIESSVLRDEVGNITHWAICESRDLNNNFIQYHCVVVNDPGILGSSQQGRQLYPDKITYTGFDKTEGPFAIDFIRDRELGEERRTDTEINLRNGYKQVSADLLRRIQVSYNGDIIRSYDLEYVEGAFKKTLLKSIAEIDRDGIEFYRHTLSYYDNIRSGNSYQPFLSNESWSVASDQVYGDIISPIPGFDGKTTVLNGSGSSMFSAGSSATVGLIGSLADKSNTAGGSVGYMTSDGSGLIALVDINGDGLSDKVFKDNDKLYYRPNLISTGTTGFGAKREIKGPVRDFNTFKTRGFSLGAEAHPVPLFVGYENTQMTNTVETYFNDFNGDGLIDIAYKGTVYFNHINADGDPEFSTDSGDTPSPVVEGEGVDPTLLEIDPAEQEARIDESPLHDIVRLWEAPFSGRISINAPVRLIEDSEASASGYTKNDGVRVAIQHNGTELWSATIDADDFTQKAPGNVSNIQINKGERIYFRVQSVFDGAYDQVAWDPEIIYLNEPLAERDANTHHPYRYKASEDFTLASSQMVSMPISGNVDISGVFEKPQTSDDVTVQITRKNSIGTFPVYIETYAWDSIVSDTIHLDSFIVAAQDELTFTILSTSNVDWGKTTWMPQLSYVSATDGTQVLSETGEPLINYCPAVDIRMFTELVSKGDLWVAPGDGVAVVERLPAPTLGSGPVAYCIKGVSRLYHKEVLNITNGIPAGVPVNIDVSAGDTIFIELTTPVRLMGLLMGASGARITFDGSSGTISTGIHTVRSDDDVIFGPMYRNWGQIVYNGNRDRANSPIDESELILDPDLADGSEDIPDIEDPDDLDGQFNAGMAPYAIMVSDPKSMAWLGNDNLTYITKDGMSSSRLGDDDITSIQFTASGSGLSAPFIITETDINSVSAGASAGVVGGTASHTWTTSHNVLDVLDFNGDRYPDIATTNKIQYTTMLGGLGAGVSNHGLGDHEAGSNATGVTFGGSYVNSSATNSGDSGGTGSSKRSASVKSNTNRSSKKSGDATRAAESSIGLSGSFTDDRDDTEESWMDINGDGLVDKVYRNGDVSLNAGYRFLPKENWGFTGLWGGESRDYGAGLGFNYSNGSIVGGISFSLTENWATNGLQDVNGDGMMDQVVSVDPMRVRLNTGSGFADPVTWNGAGRITEGSATGESLNAAFTVCIPIPILGIKICVNPSTAVGQGVSRQSRQLADVDGDGFPDYLYSNDDGHLEVKRSSIGKTNLLESVSNPLGGTIEIEYAYSGNTYEMPYAKWVMSGLRISDGVDNDGAEMYTTFTYEGGYHDRHERDFYGFVVVRSNERNTENNNEIYRSTVQVLDNSNFYTKGLLLREWVEDADSNRFIETQYTYQLRDVLTGSTLPPTYASNPAGYAFPATVEQKTLWYEGEPTAGLQTRKTFEYDVTGNVIKYTDYGNGSANDTYTATIAYHDNDQDYLKKIPMSIVLESQGEILRRRESDIDPSGDMTQFREYLNSSEAAITDLEYDQFGNLIALTRPENRNGERMKYEYTIDSIVQMYVTGIRDSYGYESAFEYDFSFGEVLKVTDINRQQFIKKLDPRGRLASIAGPYEIRDSLPYLIQYQYFHDAEVPYAVARHYDPEYQSDIETVRFVDGSGRLVQTKRTGNLFAEKGQPDALVFIIDENNIYDPFGRIVENYYPTTESLGNPGQYHTGYDGTQPTQIQFDVLDREVAIILPDNTTTTKEYLISEDNLGRSGVETRITDALNHRQSEMSDVRDRKMAASIEGPDGLIWTHYQYNAISELIATYDSKGNATEFYYDNLGRKTADSHPDGGLTEYHYDLADNMTSKVTEDLRETIPNDGEIQYTYEYERLIQIDYPRNFQNKVQLHYGEPGAEYNRAGQIWLREDASGGEEFYFDPLGQIEKSIRTLLIQQSIINTYVSEYQYDSWGRLQTMSYPDGEVVDYVYNKAGDLTGLSGKKQSRDYNYLAQVGYDKFGQMQFVEYGNGATTEYVFSPERRWLNEINTTAAGRKIMDVQYTYDPVGNVVHIENPISLIDTRPGGPSSQSFVYDPAYRLSEASGNWTVDQETSLDYTLTMSYDNLHNITRKRQVINRNGEKDMIRSHDYEYIYQSERPHTPSEVGGTRYDFDGNGNLVFARGERTYRYKQSVWDEENRLTGVSDNGYISRFTYDGNGARVIKSHGATQGIFVDGAPAGIINHADNYSAYVSPFMTARKTEFTKHYYLNGERFLSKIGTGKFNNTIWPSRGLTAGSLDFVKRMSLLQQSANSGFQQYGFPPGPPTLPYYYSQPTIVGSGASTNVQGGYSNPPPNWPGPLGPPDPEGPPGPPVWYPEQETNENVRAGYNFTGDGIFQEVDHFYYHSDNLGTTAFVTDINGEVRQYLGYTAFGEVLVDEHTTGKETPYKFNGKEFDEESGFYYYGARYYDPQTALWQSVDPLATNFPGWSPYSYTLNNPQSYTDPDGKAPGDLYRSPDAAAKSFAMRYNPKSIAEDREYGGAIYRQRDRNGKTYFAYTEPKKGGHANVSIPAAPVNRKTGRRYTIVADIHTHGAYDKKLGHGNNIFSSTDKHGNDAGEVPGYVATPNGYLQKYKPSTGKVSKVSGHIPYDRRHYNRGRPADVARAERNRRLAPHRQAIDLGHTQDFNFEDLAPQTADKKVKNNNRRFQLKDGNTRG